MVVTVFFQRRFVGKPIHSNAGLKVLRFQLSHIKEFSTRNSLETLTLCDKYQQKI